MRQDSPRVWPQVQLDPGAHTASLGALGAGSILSLRCWMPTGAQVQVHTLLDSNPPAFPRNRSDILTLRFLCTGHVPIPRPIPTRRRMDTGSVHHRLISPEDTVLRKCGPVERGQVTSAGRRRLMVDLRLGMETRGRLWGELPVTASVTGAWNPTTGQRPSPLAGTRGVHYLSLRSRTPVGINLGGRPQLIRKYLFFCFAVTQLNYFSKAPFFTAWQGY